MGTRSSIGMEMPDGTIKYVYCHWDGYISNNGAILNEHYNNVKKITSLLELGSLSSLGPEIGTKHDFDNGPKNECTFYGRDRGEKDNGPYLVYSEKEFNPDEVAVGGCEYMYLFKDNKWFVSCGETEERFVVLATMLNLKD